MTARPLTPEELSKLDRYLTAHDRRRDRLLVALGRTTGLRVSELLSLRVLDVVEAGTPVRHLRIGRQRLKGGRSARARAVRGRVIPLGEAARSLIADQIAALGTVDPEQALFP